MTDDRTLQLRLTGFRKAEASLRLEGWTRPERRFMSL